MNEESKRINDIYAHLKKVSYQLPEIPPEKEHEKALCVISFGNEFLLIRPDKGGEDVKGESLCGLAGGHRYFKNSPDDEDWVDSKNNIDAFINSPFKEHPVVSCIREAMEEAGIELDDIVNIGKTFTAPFTSMRSSEDKRANVTAITIKHKVERSENAEYEFKWFDKNSKFTGCRVDHVAILNQQEVKQSIADMALSNSISPQQKVID